MVSIPGLPPVFMWIGFILLIILFLVLDLGVFNKKKHALSVKEALIWSLVWFGLSMAFNLFVLKEFGSEYALQFFTGYLIEKSLSVDNLFVILLIFTSFKIDHKYQHRILFWGIIGALIMRGAMIGIGSALISRFEWILYLFAIFLIYSGIKIFYEKEDSYDPHDSFAVKLVKRFTHVTRKETDGNFIIRENGRLAVTIFFVVLVVIEFTDVMFAFDSIPAIFGITRDPFIVFTSNIFAILGLRSLYFVLLKAHKYFVYLPIGIAVILIFIGLKMMVEGFIDISIITSLGVVGAILLIYVFASMFLLPKNMKRKNKV
jgi:tellurite resistance protein TerC